MTKIPIKGLNTKYCCLILLLVKNHDRRRNLYVKPSLYAKDMKKTSIFTVRDFHGSCFHVCAHTKLDFSQKNTLLFIVLEDRFPIHFVPFIYVLTHV